MSDIDDIIMGGMVFKGGGGPKKDDDDKVKTKAKKKKYITGAHGSGSARQKAKYRQQSFEHPVQNAGHILRLCKETLQPLVLLLLIEVPVKGNDLKEA